MPPETTSATLAAEIVAGGGLTTAQVARRLPASRGQGRTAPSTVFRWMKKGLRLNDGRILKLQAVRLGGRFLTTEGALANFINAQTQTDEPAPAAAARPARQRRAGDADAAKQLEVLGIK